MEQAQYDVFISYSSKDYFDREKNVIPDNVISQVKSHLNDAGLSYWFDEEGIYTGDEFAPILARAIKDSEVFLFISSANSNNSDWTSSEIATAYAYKKKIIPFRIDESVYHESVIMFVSRLNRIDYYLNPDRAIGRLVESVKEHLNAKRIELERREREKEELKIAASIGQDASYLEADEPKADIPTLPSFEPSYKVLLPDGTSLEIKSLDEPIDVTITRPDHMELRLQGTIASKMTEWAIRSSEDRSEYVIGIQPVPLNKIVPIECMDIGTGIPKSDLKMLKPTVGKIEGSVLVLTGDEISQARKGIDVIVEAPYRRVSIRTEGDQQKVIKLEIVQVVSFNADEYIRRIISEYGFTPEIYCNEERVFGVIRKDFNIARNCRITIKGSEDYETYEMMMPTDGWAPSSITLQKREGRKIPFEVKGIEAQDAFKKIGKIYVESADGEREGEKGKKKETSRPKFKLRKHIFTLTPGNMSVEFKQSDMTSERMYKAELEGFRPVSFRLPKRFFGRPIELEFKPTAGTKFKKNKGWIVLLVFAFLLGVGADRLMNIQRQSADEQRLMEAKAKLVELTKNLTTVTFTSSDISALETFINEHEELEDEQEIQTAQDQIEIARSIMSFCLGDDNAVDNLKGASKEQADLIEAIKEMPELKSVEQNSKSLEDLKNELETAHAAEAQAAADAESARQLFNAKCSALDRLDCTISQLNDIINCATANGFTDDNRCKQAKELRRVIYKMTMRNSSGNPTPNQSGKDVVETIKNRIINRDVPEAALEFFQKLIDNDWACDALPLGGNFQSLSEIKVAIMNVTGVEL